MKKIAILLLIILLGVTTACSNNIGEIENGYTDFGNLELPQFQAPEKGEEIALITTTKGEIKVKLLDEVAPIAVENFKEWVDQGQYSDSSFINIYENRNIMIGKNGYSPNMTEEEASDYYDNLVESLSLDDDYVLETSTEYLHLSGAVSFARYNNPELGYENKPIGTFFIVANEGMDDETLDLMEDLSDRFGFSKDVINAYKHIGGVMDYDRDYVLFGQVFYGMDLVYEINGMTVDNSRYPVEEPVVIEKIEIVEFTGR